MARETFEFKKPEGETKDTDWIMRILQNIGGSWVQLIDVPVVNTGDLSVDLTQEDRGELLEQMTNTIYKCEKLQLGTGDTGVVFFPEHGPIRIEMMEKPKIRA